MINMSEKEIHELILKRLDLGGKNYIHNIQSSARFVDELLSILKTTPLLKNLQFTTAVFDYNYSFDYFNGLKLGHMRQVGIIIIEINNIFIMSLRSSILSVIASANKCGDDDIDHVKAISAYMTPSMILFELIATIIHESFHMHSADNYRLYTQDPEYKSYVEDNIDYSTVKFIEKHIDILKYLYCKYGGEEFYFDLLLETYRPNNEFLKEINLNNQISIVYKVLEGLFPASKEQFSEALDITRNSLYEDDVNIKLVFKYYNGNIESYPLYENNTINWSAINHINQILLAPYKVDCYVDGRNYAVIEFVMQKPYQFNTNTLMPIMRRVSDDEFKS